MRETAEQSTIASSASFLFAVNSSSIWTSVSAWVAQGEPWFYLRLGSAGLTLFRVLRESLWLGEDLG